MADQRFVNFEGKRQTFPGDATDAEISAALNAIPASNAKDVPQAKTWTPALPEESAITPAMTMAGTASAVSPAARLLAQFSASPTAAATASALAKNATTMGGVVQGVATLNPAQVLAASKEGWAAGKGAYFLTKGAQSAARPVASVIDTIAPYAKGAMRTAAGAQGVLDLAQMAEPNRKDIGVLGVGTGDKGDPNHPALLNLAATKIMDAVKSLIDKGMSEKEAVRTLLNLKAKGQ